MPIDGHGSTTTCEHGYTGDERTNCGCPACSDQDQMRWHQYLIVPWSLSAGTPGVVYADGEDGFTKKIARFENHVLAADAVCAHNAVLAVRPHV